MKKQYEAYYSPKWAWLWLVLAILFAIGIGLCAFFWNDEISLVFIILFSVLCLVFLYMCIKTKREKGVAIEIIDDILILHKKEIVSIPLNKIFKINIHNATGSFDIIVETFDKKVSLHCFVKDEREKKRELIDFLKSKNIKFSTYDLM